MSDQINEREVLAAMRHGVVWYGDPKKPTHAEMEDGYWVPWHLADSLMKDMEQRIAELEAGQQAAINIALENLAREFTFREGAYYLSSLEVQKKIRSHIKGESE